MRITQAQRTVKDQVVSRGKLQTTSPSSRAIAGMFDNGKTQGLNDLAKGLNAASNTAAYIANDLNNTEAREAANKFQQGFMAFQAEAQKKKGKDGMNTAADYASWRDKELASLTKGMNDVALGRAMAIIDAENASYTRWSEGYGFQEETNYKITTQQAVIDSNADMLASNINDPELAEQSILQTMQAAREVATMKGLGPEATEQLEKDSVRRALMPAIGSVIEGGNIGAAKGMMEQYSGLLGGVNVQKLNTAIDRERKRQQAEFRANEARAKTESVKAEIPYVLQEYGEDPESMLAYLQDKYGDDYETIGRVYNSSMGVLRMQESAEDYNTKKYNESQLEGFEKALDTGRLNPTQASQMLLDLPEEVQSQGKRLLDRAFAPEGSFVSDPAVLQQTKEQIMTGQSVDWAKVKPYLSSVDLNKALEKEKSLKGKAANTAMRPTFYTELKNFGIDELPEKYQLSKTDLYNMFASDAYEQGITDPLEMQKYMQDWLRKVTVNQEGVFGIPFTGEQYSVPRGLGTYMVGEDEDFSFVGGESETPDISQEQRAQIIEALTSKGIVPTEQNINTTYLNSLKSKGQ